MFFGTTAVVLCLVYIFIQEEEGGRVPACAQHNDRTKPLVLLCTWYGFIAEDTQQQRAGTFREPRAANHDEP